MKPRALHAKPAIVRERPPVSQRTAVYSAPDAERIPVSKPWIDSAEEEAVVNVLRSGWLVQGDKVADFERKVACEVSNEYAVAVSSGTTALHLALTAAKVSAGDNVLVPAFSFVATANVVEQCGAIPVFADIDLDTFTVDPDKILKHIFSKRLMGDSRPKVIMPVSLFGHPINVKRIAAISREFNIPVIEDAACGLGSVAPHEEDQGEFLSRCFSFHPRKIITTGEGGMITSNDEDYARLCKQLRDHGAVRDDRPPYLMPLFPQVGFNYRMTDLQGAIGSVQIDKLNAILSERATQASIYASLLKDCKQVKLPQAAAGATHSWQAYVCLYTGGQSNLKDLITKKPDLVESLSSQRDTILGYMEEHGVSVRQGTHAIHLLEFYRSKYGLKPSDFPNAALADKLSFALPFYHGMSDAHQDRVVSTLRQAIASAA